MRAATSGDSSNELLSEVRWLQWEVRGSDFSLPTTDLHLPNLSVLELSGSEDITEDSKLWWSPLPGWEDDPPLPTTNLHLPNLSVLDLSDSRGITEDWEGWRSWSSFMMAKRLQVLDLTWCEGFRCTPDLSAFPQLKILILSGCLDLEHLHPSIGKLISLVSLDLSDYDSLKELPEEVGELKDLEELKLSFTGITEIPTSIGSLRKLKKLSAYCCMSLREIPSSIGDLQNLQHLELTWSGLEKLPSAIGDLSSLQCLDLCGCDKLLSLPQLSSLIHLEKLHLRECDLLEDIPELPLRLLKLCIVECGKLISLKLDGWKNLEKFSIKSAVQLKDWTFHN